MHFLALLTFSFISSAAPEIIFSARTEVGAKSELHLSDIAKVSGFGDAKVEDALREISLGDSPRAGEMRKFTDVGLAQVLRSHLSNLHGEQNVHLVIPESVTVMGALEFPRQMVMIELRDQLQALCSPCQIEITQLTTPTLQEQSAVESWHIRSRSDLPRGNFSVPIDIKFRNGKLQSAWLTGSMIVKKNILVLKNSKLQGDALSINDFTEEIRDVTFSGIQPANRLDVEGAVVMQSMEAGAIISKNKLRRQPGAIFGETVKVQSASEQWQISVDGVAQKSAQIGENISVKIPRTQKTLSGKLISRGIVEVP